MPPQTIHFLSVPSDSEVIAIAALGALTPKPVTVAKAHYFVSESHLSKSLKNTSATKSSPFNLVTVLPGASTSLPPSVKNLTTQTWTFNAEIEDQLIQNYHTSSNSDSATAPVEPFPLHSETQPDPNEEAVEFTLTVELRTFLSTFSSEYAGPVTMINLLKFHDGMFPQYQKYMEGFQEVLAPKYDVSLALAGPILDDEENKGMLFDMTGWVRYAGGAASFGRMLEDEAYKDLDRKFKRGVVRDNPILLIVDLKEGL